MRDTTRAVLVGLLILGASLSRGISTARAQGVGLGGYGAMTGGSGPAMGGAGGGTLVPFGGRFGAVMPSGTMGGGARLSFRSRSSESMNGSRTPFRIGPMGAGMGQGSGRRPFTLEGAGPGLMSAPGNDMRRRMPGSGGMEVMPPSLGYPFRQPPSLMTPSSSGLGMSM